MYHMKSSKKLKTLLVALLVVISNWRNRSSSHWLSRMEMELQGAEETRDFVDGSSGPNLQMTQHFTVPLALERWRWICIAPKKLETLLVVSLVQISQLRNRSSSYWLSRGGDGSALRQRNLRLCWWFLWSKSPNYATGQAPIGSRGWKWSYIVPKKLETSVVDPLVLISSWHKISHSHWLSRREDGATLAEMFASTSSKAPKNCPHLKKLMWLGFNHFLECLSASRHDEILFGDSSGFERRVTFSSGWTVCLELLLKWLPILSEWHHVKERLGPKTWAAKEVLSVPLCQLLHWRLLLDRQMTF